MNIAEATIRFRTFSLIATLAMVAGGVYAYMTMGRLEDPEFTIKEALIITHYPGASATEVAEEVTDAIETAVQRMGQVDHVESISEPGRSVVKVVMRDRYDGNALPQIWDELRRRVDDAARTLPPGTSVPLVRDDFGDVYGVFYAISGDGFPMSTLEEYAETLRRELLLVEDVGSIQLFGVQPEVVFVEFATERIAQLGLAPELLIASLVGQNLAVDAGEIVAGNRRLRVEPTGQFRSVEEIGDLLILNNTADGTRLYLRDIATITRGYADPPANLMFFNGAPAIGVALSTVSGGNVVRMGDAVTSRMKELEAQIPIGVEIGLVAHQADTVTAAIDVFVTSLVQAFAIVIGTLMIFMGLRSGLIIGLGLVLTVLGTFVIMKATGVMLERVSLGALVIALALMVDNAIVIVDGMQGLMQRGINAIEAASRVVRQTAMPLLGATFVAVFAFAAIGLSQDRTGEYTVSLFLVMLYSLMLSWVLAITITPLLGFWMMSVPKTPQKEPFTGAVFRGYRRFLDLCFRHRMAVLLVVLGLLISAVLAFRHVERSFFPPSTRLQFMVHSWAPRGTAIEVTTRDALAMADTIMGFDGVTDVATFVGAGSPRFLLTYTPEDPSPAYALTLVSVDDPSVIGPLLAKIERDFRESFPDHSILARRFSLGPSHLQRIQVRIRGSDPEVLQSIKGDVMAAFSADADIVDLSDNWRERTPLVVPVVNEIHARDAGLTRRDIAQAIRFSTDGIQVGLYREGDALLPIIARPRQGERQTIESVRDAEIWSPIASRRIPLRQVVGEFRTTSEHTIHHRRDRLPTITVKADAASGDADGAVRRLMPAVAAIALPPGYSIDWGGEFEDSTTAQRSLAGNLPLVGILMVLTVIALFNAVRPPLIVFTVVPLGIIGVSFGLLATGQPFGFMALLGFMSLSGMLIKNAIVLLDEIGVRIKDSDNPLMAIREAGVSRLSPVMLAAFTTVLGMIPLLSDAFFVAMSVAIMAGLTFATVLTLVVVPVLYAVLFRVQERPRMTSPPATPSAEPRPE
ncbi:MAG: efflux RND transporter permease subunit [Phycisphaeraceae bacterium]|nr:efflux RND transporter permease subunit [Phycisphaeraceae bacterium]